MNITWRDSRTLLQMNQIRIFVFLAQEYMFSEVSRYFRVVARCEHACLPILEPPLLQQTHGGTFIFLADALPSNLFCSAHCNRLISLSVITIALDSHADLCPESRNFDDQSTGRVMIMIREIHRERERVRLEQPHMT